MFRTTLYLGWMIGRKSKAIRLLLTSSSFLADTSFLERYFQPGHCQATKYLLFETLTEIRPYLSAVNVQIDVEEKISGAVNFECEIPFFSSISQHKKSVECILKVLKKRGLCTRKLFSFIEWVGIDATASQKLCRYINNIKLLYKPNKPLTAKIYFLTTSLLPKD